MSEQIPPESNGSDGLIADILARGKNQTGEVYGDTDDDFVIKIRELTEHFNLHPQNVLYPGSNQHAGVARVFGRDRVMHVDPDAASMETMSKEGYQVDANRVEDYKPGKQFDLIVSYNAGTIEPDEIERLLSPTGYVIANNWHGSANRMATYKNFRLMGAILPSIHEGTVVDSDTAVQGLGTTRIGVIPGGIIVTGEAVDEATMSVFDNKNSPDGLFLFQRREEVS